MGDSTISINHERYIIIIFLNILLILLFFPLILFFYLMYEKYASNELMTATVALFTTYVVLVIVASVMPFLFCKRVNVAREKISINEAKKETTICKKELMYVFILRVTFFHCCVFVKNTASPSFINLIKNNYYFLQSVCWHSKKNTDDYFFVCGKKNIKNK